MLNVTTTKEFRNVASQVILCSEDLIPEREPEGHWRLRPRLSINDLDEPSQNLLVLYKKEYHSTIIDQYKQKGQQLTWKRPPKWAYLSTNFKVNAKLVIAMIVLRNPRIPPHSIPNETANQENPSLPLREDESRTPQAPGKSSVKRTAEPFLPPERLKKTHEPGREASAPISTDAQLLDDKVREEPRVAILKSIHPPAAMPFQLIPGDILVLDGEQGLLVSAGGVAGVFIPYEVEHLVEGDAIGEVASSA